MDSFQTLVDAVAVARRTNPALGAEMGWRKSRVFKRWGGTVAYLTDWADHETTLASLRAFATPKVLPKQSPPNRIF